LCCPDDPTRLRLADVSYRIAPKSISHLLPFLSFPCFLSCSAVGMFVSYSSITEWQNLSKTKSRQAVSKSREGEAPVPIYNSEDEMRHKHRPSTTRLSWACSCTSELPTPHSRIVVSLDQIRPLRMYLNPSVLPNLTSINKSSSFLPSCRPYPSNNTVVINSKPLSQICTTPPPPLHKISRGLPYPLTPFPPFHPITSSRLTTFPKLGVKRPSQAPITTPNWGGELNGAT
jgi:hypothetical protein